MKILYPLAKRFIAGHDFESAKPVIQKMIDDVHLKDGDIIIVPLRNSSIEISGEVQREAIYELTDNENLGMKGINYFKELFKNIFWLKT